MRRSIMLVTLLAAVPPAGCSREVVPPLASQTDEPPAVAVNKDGLAPPVPLELDGRPLESGSPFLGDIDGDGRADLLMGGDHTGRLRVYRNVGTPTAPRLSGPQWFDDRVPTGRIPKG